MRKENDSSKQASPEEWHKQWHSQWHEQPSWKSSSFSRWRFGQRGWIRPLILKTLEKGPKNGIEIMESIHEMSNGWWKPSPGSIYPMLEQLSKEGLIQKNKEKRYKLSNVYKEDNMPKDSISEVLENIEGYISYLEELSESKPSSLKGHSKRIKEASRRLLSMC